MHCQAQVISVKHLVYFNNPYDYELNRVFPQTRQNTRMPILPTKRVYSSISDNQ